MIYLSFSLSRSFLVNEEHLSEQAERLARFENCTEANCSEKNTSHGHKRPPRRRWRTLRLLFRKLDGNFLRLGLKHASIDFLFVLLIFLQFVSTDFDHVVDFVFLDVVALDGQKTFQRVDCFFVSAELKQRFALSKQRLDVRRLITKNVADAFQTLFGLIRQEKDLSEIVLHLNVIVDERLMIFLGTRRMFIDVEKTNGVPIALQCRGIISTTKEEVTALFLLLAKSKRTKTIVWTMKTDESTNPQNNRSATERLEISSGDRHWWKWTSTLIRYDGEELTAGMSFSG